MQFSPPIAGKNSEIFAVGFPVADYLPLLGVGVLAFNAAQMFAADAKSGKEYGAKSSSLLGNYEDLASQQEAAKVAEEAADDAGA